MPTVKSPLFSDAFFSAAKEAVLNLLFPRTCPLCGRLLSLPRGWARDLSVRSHTGVPTPSEIRRFRTILFCEDCCRDLQFVDAPFCAVCSRPLDTGEGPVCDLCRNPHVSFDRGRALLFHDNAARKILYDLKFHNRRENACAVGFLFALRFADEICAWEPDALLPVPLHKKRMRERGFNQAHLIAEQCSFWLEKLFDIRIQADSRTLLRTENTKPQRTLASSARAENVRRAFSVSGTARYRTVILVDDIFTSGSTLDACAKTLKEAGVSRVFFLTASIVS